ncbi:hypothetical protein J421_5808 (plasmid) [Gemmatirosa kalamazoonensis]|uniref:Uncharacterized protein n=1 Tax=Gemmatirosa kalamazoonensis TaxID=861299 RepID=W0RUT2_9BACT|nr:hypothetical protein [Gemmatirosa kalamazoonensis]AHG93343.1 hypothetical protein J421_5808 [Gemmatirosa kalamazoonensis]
MRRTRPAGATAPPLYAADAAHRVPEVEILPGVDEASLCEEWDYTRDYCTRVRWTVAGRPYSAAMSARAWATSASAPIFVDEWHAGPLTDGGGDGSVIRFHVPSDRWWSSARIVRTAMEQLDATQPVQSRDRSIV